MIDATLWTFFSIEILKQFPVAPWKSLFRGQIKVAIDFHIINRFEMLANELNSAYLKIRNLLCQCINWILIKNTNNL